MTSKIGGLILALALFSAAGIEPAIAKTLLPIDPLVSSSGTAVHPADGSSTPRSMNRRASPEQLLAPRSSGTTRSDRTSPRSNISSRNSRDRNSLLTDDLVSGLEMRTGFTGGGRNPRSTTAAMSGADLGEAGVSLSQSLSDGQYNNSSTQKGRRRSATSGDLCLGAISSLQCGE